MQQSISYLYGIVVFYPLTIQILDSIFSKRSAFLSHPEGFAGVGTCFGAIIYISAFCRTICVDIIIRYCINSAGSLITFQRHLKTHLFDLAYSPCFAHPTDSQIHQLTTSILTEMKLSCAFVMMRHCSRIPKNVCTIE